MKTLRDYQRKYPIISLLLYSLLFVVVENQVTVKAQVSSSPFQYFFLLFYYVLIRLDWRPKFAHEICEIMSRKLFA